MSNAALKVLSIILPKAVDIVYSCSVPCQGVVSAPIKACSAEVTLP